MTTHRWHRAGGPAARVAFGVLLAGALTLGGCTKPPGRDLQPGSYRAVLGVPGGKELPFGLDVAREETGPVLYLINGEERVRVTEVDTRPGQLTARMPGYETTLTATISGGQLAGVVRLVHAEGRLLELPFEATLGETWRFHPKPLSDNADMAGRWDVTFSDARGRRVHGVAELAQRFEQVTGTVVMPADDQRYLAGEVRDEELRLSRFDGGAAVLYEAKLDSKGNLVGEAWTDRDGRQRFVAKRNPDADVDAGAIATQLRNPEAGFDFAFRDLDGRTVASSDPQFRGKVMLVTLAGSWCPNSHDEAALLAKLDRKYRQRGLAVVSLMFEQHAEFERAVAAIRRFRAAYDIDYPTLVAGRMEKSLASTALPQLDAVRAYPTALFIDRTGRVRKIHTGFAGPATGVRHELLVQGFEQTIEALLAEPAPNP
ncbi:MAG TPA: TlpA disulfide reductase family protein [Steroidobacteraceae bacterium]|nr:TlpA disulfide reductase family protein [Steroidobacteraceae bacterium]